MKQALLGIVLMLFSKTMFSQDFSNSKNIDDSLVVMKKTIDEAGEGRLSYFHEHFQYLNRKSPSTFNHKMLLYVEDKLSSKKKLRK